MLRPVSLALIATLALSAGVASSALLVADLAAARPRAFMDEWVAGRSIGAHADRQRMLDRLAMAVSLAPLDAEPFFDLGRFYAWHASLHPPGDERHRIFTARALAAFEQAMARRPSWGYAWVRAAEQRVVLDLDPRRTLDMVLRADRLAPREAITQLKVVWVGLGFWSELDEREREHLAASLHRLLADPHHALDAARIAHHHGRLDLVRGFDAAISSDPQYRRLIESSDRATSREAPR